MLRFEKDAKSEPLKLAQIVSHWLQDMFWKSLESIDKCLGRIRLVWSTSDLQSLAAVVANSFKI